MCIQPRLAFMDLVDWEVHAISHQAFKCNVIQSTSDEAAGRLAYVAQHLDAHHSLLRFLFHINSSSCHLRIHRPLCSTHALCLTDSACSSSTVTSPCPVDHDMKPERIRTELTPSLTGGSRTRTRVPAEEGGTLSCAPSADAVAGNGGPLNWPPFAAPSRGRGAAHAWRSADSRGSCGPSLHEHPWNTTLCKERLPCRSTTALIGFQGGGM